jgi:transposase-like protein
MTQKDPFKWKHYQKEKILLCVRWYLRYSLSYRDLEEMMLERGIEVDHTTIYRWVQQLAPEIDKRTRPFLKPTNDSWKVDETYIKVKGKWKYLYRAIDSEGNTLEFMLSARRDHEAAMRFFKKVLKAKHNKQPRVINVDKNAAYPPAIEKLKEKKILDNDSELRAIKYLNNRIEQDHRFIKRRVNPGLGFHSFNTARRTLAGYEIMNAIRKGQVNNTKKGDILAQNKFISSLFETIA